MSLTLGTGPFGSHPGQFNFERRGPDRVLYWEPFAKRFRVEIDDTIVADSRAAMLLHEQGQLPRVYLPRADVALDRLQPSDHRTRCPWKGEARYWFAGRARNVAWSYDEPIESAPGIGGFVSFDLDAVDAWYEEEREGYAHPRDPYHRVDVLESTRHVVIRRDDVVIAESRHPAMLFETALPPRYYLPPEDVRTDLFERSETVSQCPYKGAGRHWHLTGPGARVEDAAWTLPEPLGEAKAITGWYSFYPDKLTIEVDGERLPGE